MNLSFIQWILIYFFQQVKVLKLACNEVWMKALSDALYSRWGASVF